MYILTQEQRHLGDTPTMSKYTRQGRQKVNLKLAVSQLFWGPFPK